MKKSSVLIIEDDESNRKILEMTLRSMNLETRWADNGESGFQAAESDPPALIFMDVMMPKQSGLQTLHQMRAHPVLKNIPVFVVSAKAAEKDKESAMQAGANEFITKPFRVKIVQDLVEKYLFKK